MIEFLNEYIHRALSTLGPDRILPAEKVEILNLVKSVLINFQFILSLLRQDQMSRSKSDSTTQSGKESGDSIQTFLQSLSGG